MLTCRKQRPTRRSLQRKLPQFRESLKCSKICLGENRIIPLVKCYSILVLHYVLKSLILLIIGSISPFAPFAPFKWCRLKHLWCRSWCSNLHEDTGPSDPPLWGGSICPTRCTRGDCNCGALASLEIEAGCVGVSGKEV